MVTKKGKGHLKRVQNISKDQPDKERKCVKNAKVMPPLTNPLLRLAQKLIKIKFPLSPAPCLPLKYNSPHL